MAQDKTPQHIKLDERNHVEKPLLDQLESLSWEIIDLDSKQTPSDSYRQSFTEVVMLPVLREQIKGLNPLEGSQSVTSCHQLNMHKTSHRLLEKLI